MKKIISDLQGPILVIGASGFIGANLYRHIAKVRSDVFAVVRHEPGWRLSSVDVDRVIAADLNDYAATLNLINSINPKTIFDLSAYGAYSFEKDINKIYETNYLAMVNLVQCLREKNIAAYIHAGSSSEYGLNSAAPLEGEKCEPNSHYALSKLSSAQYIEYLGKHHDFPGLHLRLYSVYGPLEDTSRLIPTAIEAAMHGRLPPFVDPNTSRDFIYIDDVCEAFIVSAASMSRKLYGEIFNIGSGLKTTIRELAYTVKSSFNVNEEPKFGSLQGRDWDLPDWYSNSDKAKHILGWSPKISLTEGLLKISEWIQEIDHEDFKKFTKRDALRRRRSISAIVACYKDGEAIPHMYQRLTDTFKKMDIDYEIIFVNDCSPDNSIQVIENISKSDPKVLGICHSRNFGSQMAFRSGMELSSKSSVVLLDGDLQDPPELIPQFYEKWLEGNDVIYGRRVSREMSWHMGLMYKAFYRIFALFSYVPIPHDAGDFSLIDRRVVGWLLQCSERDLFMRGLRAYVGFKQTGVDYVRPERLIGKSTNNLLKNIEWAKRGIFSFSNAPLTMLTALGVILLVISLGLAISAAILKIFYPEIAPKGATTLLISTLLFGSLNLFAIGLVGEYIGKIMLEVKGRPRLIRSALIRNGAITELLPDGKGKI